MESIEITPCEEYKRYIKRYRRVRDLVDGEAKLKEVDLRCFSEDYANYSDNDYYRVNYLRAINPVDKGNYNTKRNIEYIKGARLYNATVKTLSGLLGMLFRVPPMLPELPSDLEYLIENINGSGLSMHQQIQSVASDVTQIGRDGLLVDMPRNDEGKEITKLDVNNGFRAGIYEYKAESIIDYHEAVINGVKKLVLLVLSEDVESYKDTLRISRELSQQIKVFRLTDEGVTIQTFTKGEKGLKKGDEMPVLAANNQKLDRIPFFFIGSKNNQPCADPLPLEPIADINVGHYQESANLASSSFQLSACQPVISDDNYQRASRDPNNDDIVELGEDSVILLGSDGSFSLVSPPENTMSKAIQKDYEEQMIALGAQLITNSGGVETAEAARIKRASDVSDLELIARNVGDAYTKAIEVVCLMMGVQYNDEWTVSLNTNFFESKLTPQEQAEVVRTWQAGAISKSVLDDKLQSGGVIGEAVDLEEMNQVISEEVISLGFDDDEDDEGAEDDSNV